MKTTCLFSSIFALLLAFSAYQTAQAGQSRQDDLIEQGRYIATIAGCTSCHTPLKADYLNPQALTLEQIQTIAFNERDAQDTEKLLAGGRLFDLGPAGMVFTRNITPDDDTGIGAWSDDQLKLAIKSGVAADGEVLFPVMPYHVYNRMADSDIDAVIAYLRSVTPVANEVPEDTVSTEGFPTLPFETGITAPDSADRAVRGAYLVNNVMGCTDCHTPVDPATGAPQMDKYLAGRQPYEGPWGIVYGGNITPDEETGIGTWTEEEVQRALLTGVGRDGRRLILMPWYAYSSLTSEDAEAVAFYLKKVLPAVKNQIPAAALNTGFTIMATEESIQGGSNGFVEMLSPLLIVIAGVAIILLVSFIAYYVRHRPS